MTEADLERAITEDEDEHDLEPAISAGRRPERLSDHRAAPAGVAGGRDRGEGGGTSPRQTHRSGTHDPHAGASSPQRTMPSAATHRATVPCPIKEPLSRSAGPAPHHLVRPAAWRQRRWWRDVDLRQCVWNRKRIREIVFAALGAEPWPPRVAFEELAPRRWQPRRPPDA
jgi:hypothetical protein